MLEGLEERAAPGDDAHLGGSEPVLPGPGTDRPDRHRPPRAPTDPGPGPGGAYVEVDRRREPREAPLHPREESRGARRARVPDPFPPGGRSAASPATPGAAGPEGSHLDRRGELPGEPTVGEERREQVKLVRTGDRAEPYEGRPELFDLVSGACLTVTGGDRARGHSALAEPLLGLVAAREGAGELLQAHVQRAAGSVRLFDRSGLGAPGTSPAEPAGSVRCGAHAPRGGDRERRRRARPKSVDPHEGRPLPRAVDGPRERAAGRTEQMDRVAGRREPTAGGEDLLDVAETSADDGGEQVDVDPRTPRARLSRRDGRA